MLKVITPQNLGAEVEVAPPEQFGLVGYEDRWQQDPEVGGDEGQGRQTQTRPGLVEVLDRTGQAIVQVRQTDQGWQATELPAPGATFGQILERKRGRVHAAHIMCQPFRTADQAG